MENMNVHVPRLIRPPGKRLWHPTHGRGQVLSPEGDVLWEDPDWMENTLTDAGEQSMLNVYLKEQANPTKYLALLNDASLAETDGNITLVTESKAPGADAYARQQIVAGDWTDDGLQGGDYRFSAAEKTFGPITGTALTATAAALVTTAAGTTAATLVLIYVALSGTTTVNVGQSFKYILRWTQQ